MKRKLSFAAALTVVSALLSGAAVAPAVLAAPVRHDAAFRDFHGREFRTFSRIERDQWIRGHWIRGWRGGQFGWWWSVGPYWYWYNQPIYPYPDYIPPLVEAPPVVVPPAANPGIWYYCDNPQGYYPYVSACDSPWHQVPAAPPGAPQAG